ncbi:MAG: hypothetical protein MZV70_08445 [Desulfobacterales bacterium]|nr:hypothetical protein [Desulfobacterales bacterium]
MKLDKARTKVGRISKFGLLEMSRQRIHPSIEFGSHVACRCCQGKGMIPSTETLGIGFLRKLGMEALQDEVARVKGVVPPAVADYLLNTQAPGHRGVGKPPQHRHRHRGRRRPAARRRAASSVPAEPPGG